MAEVLQFPIEGAARDQLGDVKRSFVHFQAIENGAPMANIFLPTPANMSIPDSITYNTAGFGSISTAEDWANKVKSGGTNILKSIGDQGTSATSQVGAGDLVAQVSKRLGRVINPNTNTTFEGTGVRAFSFDFKLIPRSEKDSNTINNIHRTFRKYAYPARLDDGTLGYPAKWRIVILASSNQGSGANKYIPQPLGVDDLGGGCYLVSLNTNINEEGNVFHKDGAPYSVSIQLQFQEDRSLQRPDIEAL